MRCLRALVVFASVVVFHSSAQAQDGLDAVNNEMIHNGLFNPHANNCVSGEAFMALGSGGTSGATGICIETSERSAAVWESARQTCAALGKRLPEVAEYKIACKAAGSLGLSNMTNNNEWASNFPFMFNLYEPDGTGVSQWSIPISGNGNCLHVEFENGQHSRNVEGTVAFRCVH